MTRPWSVIEQARTDSGELELRRRGEPEDRDFLLLVDGRVLMNSRADRSERALAHLGLAPIASRPGARCLVGGLGMGITARAALDELAPDARLEVAELEPVIVEWCRGPLAPVSEHALDDERLEIVVGDVAERIASAGARDERYDAILLDLLEGPHARTAASGDPLYGRDALERTREALTPGGALAVWGEEPDAAFEGRLRAVGFRVERHRPGRGGRRHVVHLALRGGAAS